MFILIETTLNFNHIKDGFLGRYLVSLKWIFYLFVLCFL